MVTHKRGRARKFLTALTELDIGLCVTFQYPRYNFHAVKSSLKVRRIKIEDVRLLSAKPLDPFTVETQPLLRRGTVLVTGYDYDKRARRSFYLESMEELLVIQEPKAEELPPLYVTIEDNGRAVHTISMTDPRVSFCRHWKDLHAGENSIAIAVD